MKNPDDHPMLHRSALGVRGHLIDVRNDGRFVFRVYGDPDPVTGRKSITDYDLRVMDLNVEITSGYYALFDPAPGSAGKPYLDYRPRGDHGEREKPKEGAAK